MGGANVEPPVNARPWLSWLLRPNGSSRIRADGSERRHQAAGERHSDSQNARDEDRCGIERTQTGQQRLHGTSGVVRQNKSEYCAGTGEDDPIAQNHRQDIARLGSKSNAKAEFRLSLSDGEGEQAMDANSGKTER